MRALENFFADEILFETVPYLESSFADHQKPVSLKKSVRTLIMLVDPEPD